MCVVCMEVLYNTPASDTLPDQETLRDDRYKELEMMAD